MIIKTVAFFTLALIATADARGTPPASEDQPRTAPRIRTFPLLVPANDVPPLWWLSNPYQTLVCDEDGHPADMAQRPWLYCKPPGVEGPLE